MDDTREGVYDVIRDVLLAPELPLSDTSTAHEVEDWDSLAQLSIMFSLESRFGVTFTDREMGELADVGELVRAVEAKRA